MIVQEFAFRKMFRQTPPKDTVRLECSKCGEVDVRDKHNLYTGHLHDGTCTYVCKVCKGDMKEVM